MGGAPSQGWAVLCAICPGRQTDVGVVVQEPAQDGAAACSFDEAEGVVDDVEDDVADGRHAVHVFRQPDSTSADTISG